MHDYVAAGETGGVSYELGGDYGSDGGRGIDGSCRISDLHRHSNQANQQSCHGNFRNSFYGCIE
jgi:hypothetical protein